MNKMREHLISRLEQYFMPRIAALPINEDLNYATLVQEVLDKATTEQLYFLAEGWAIPSREVVITGYNSSEGYICMTYAGMFIGMEKDGYAHS